MPAESNPTVARRRLAVRLRGLREQQGRSLNELASVLSVSLAQASRLDTGARGFKPSNVDTLAEWYGLSPREHTSLQELVAESAKRAWWQQIDLDDSYRSLIGFERRAVSISEFGGAVVPGLLQTGDYANAAASGSSVDLPAGVTEQAVDVRMRRQEVLRREKAPLLWVVIDEAVLARTTGGREVMSAQLDHLLEAAETPRVTVQIIGFEAGTHLGSRYTQFILLGMGSVVPDVLYHEGMLEPTDTDAPAALETYRRVWDMLRALALDPEASRDRILSYHSALKSGW